MTPITIDEAIKLVRENSFTTDEGRTIVHTFAGPFGADWDLEGVENFLRGATTVGFSNHIFGHDLVAVNERVVRFDVQAPDNV